jgi:hypothetical protein
MSDAPLDLHPLRVPDLGLISFERDPGERLEAMAASGVRPLRALAAAIVAVDVRLGRPTRPSGPAATAAPIAADQAPPAPARGNPAAPTALAARPRRAEPARRVPGPNDPTRPRRAARSGRPANRPLRAERGSHQPFAEAMGSGRTFGVCDDDAWARWAAGQADDERLAELDAELQRQEKTRHHAGQRWNSWLDSLAERDHAVIVRVRRRLPGTRV